MLKNNNKYLVLHFIVFIWGFTAIIGKLISLQALDLVWWRMFLASIFIFLYLKFSKTKIDFNKTTIFQLAGVGVLIALHWLTFYHSIKVSNISIALASFSTGAFFVSFIEPLLTKKKINYIETLFGLIAVIGLSLVAYSSTQSTNNFLSSQNSFLGIFYGLIAAILAALFSVFNSYFATKNNPVSVSLIEMFSGFLFLTVVLLISGNLGMNTLEISLKDLFWLLILASICTAFTFIVSVNIMKHISPFTMMLSINLEPVYGIILALLIFPETEKMNFGFYVGTSIILATVIANGIVKARIKDKISK